MTGKRRNTLGNLPQANGVLARLACARLNALGIDTKPLVERVGLSVQQIKNRSLRISARSQVRLLDIAAAESGDELLGFHLARDVDLREMGLLYYAAASSATLGDALQRLARYCSITNEGMAFHYHEGSYLRLTASYVDVARHSDQQQIEAFMTAVVLLTRQLCGRNLVPARICFTHFRNEVPSEFRAVFGGEVLFGSHTDEVCFDTVHKYAQIVSADPYLNEILIKICEEALSQRHEMESALRLRIENAIAPLLPHGKGHISDVSKILGMGERTLARRLASEGLTFAKILDELRSDLAKRYLKEDGLSISQIAWLLGYQALSGFTHSFKRKTGKTPKQARAEITTH